jgi:hypothetical protein
MARGTQNVQYDTGVAHENEKLSQEVVHMIAMILSVLKLDLSCVVHHAPCVCLKYRKAGTRVKPNDAFMLRDRPLASIIHERVLTAGDGPVTDSFVNNAG